MATTPTTDEKYFAFLKERLGQMEDLFRTKKKESDILEEITRAINDNMPTEALLLLFENNLRNYFGIQQILLYIHDKDWRVGVASGVDPKSLSLDIKEDLGQIKHVTPVKETELDKLNGFNTIIPVIHKQTPLAYALLGGSNSDLSRDEKEERDKFLQTYANVIIVAIENKKLFRRQLEQEVIKKELELAAQMQSMLIPKNLPCNEKMDIAAVYLPHRDIGGDYYDFIPLDDNSYAVCIADISGKGVAAGLLMANFQANLRTLINKEYPLEQVVDMLNFKVNEITGGEKYITLFLAVFDYQSRRLRYVNAGHNPSFLMNDGVLSELDQGCTILGMFESLPFVNVGEVDLEADALLFNYTDGLTDLENAEGEMLEGERIEQFIKNNSQLNMSDFNQKLLDYIDEFKGEGMFNDDISILSCRFH